MSSMLTCPHCAPLAVATSASGKLSGTPHPTRRADWRNPDEEHVRLYLRRHLRASQRTGGRSRLGRRWRARLGPGSRRPQPGSPCRSIRRRPCAEQSSCRLKAGLRTRARRRATGVSASADSVSGSQSAGQARAPTTARSCRGAVIEIGRFTRQFLSDTKLSWALRILGVDVRAKRSRRRKKPAALGRFTSGVRCVPRATLFFFPEHVTNSAPQ